MKKTLTVLAVVLGCTAFAEGDVAKVFVDKGSTYLRSEKKLKVGDELVMVTDAAGATEAGHALVMEVNGALVRVTLDDEAAKANAKFARLSAPVAAKSAAPAAKPAPVVAAAAPAAAAPAAAQPPPPTPPAAAAPPAPPALTGPTLKGRLEANGFRAVAYNDSPTPWTGCEFRFSDGGFHDIGTVGAMSDESSVLIKFTWPPDPPFNGVTVKCAEGEAFFKFSEPAAKHALDGFAEVDGSRVTINNSGDTEWTRCDVRKPDGTHYVMGRLKAHDRDSARGGAFQKSNDAPKPPRWLTLTCKEGSLRQQVY